ncbi:hypothetical protein AB0G05_39320 [Nonomuraea wenchangensis]
MSGRGRQAEAARNDPRLLRAAHPGPAPGPPPRTSTSGGGYRPSRSTACAPPGVTPLPGDPPGAECYEGRWGERP